MKGKTVLLTGGTSGIGLAAAAALAEQGATVVITARDAEKGARALAQVGGDSHVVHLDLASLAGVRTAAREFLDRFDRLDVLVCNAGGIVGKRRLTEDGFEMTFGAGHLGHFLLTHLLLERIKASAPARIVTVSSVGHKQGTRGLDFDDLDWERRRYRAFRAYGATKLANVLFAKELARRLDPARVTANAMHPGFVATGFGQQGDTRVLGIGERLGKVFARTPEEGADTVVWLASSPEVEGKTGGYWVSRREKATSKRAASPEDARRLWEISERLVGLKA